MVLLVQKYGGSSLTDLSKLSVIARRVLKYVQAGYDVVLVLSAMQGETDRLIQLANLVTKHQSKREYDQLLAVGEQTAVCLMVLALEDIGVRACSLNAWQANITSDAQHQRASIKGIDTDAIGALLSQSIVPVITGFQALGSDHALTTLGRGGSDTTAVAVAAALNADECQIFIDEQGIYTADPKVMPSARLIHKMDIHQLLAYSCMGAKVMQKRAVAIAARYKVPMRICPTFTEGLGTVIDYTQADKVIERTQVSAVASVRNYVLLICQGALEDKQALDDLLACLTLSGLDLEHTLRQLPNAKFQLDCMCSDDDFNLIRAAVEQWQEACSQRSVRSLRGKAKVSLLGYALARDIGVTQVVMDVLGKANIHCYHIGALDYQVSILIDAQYLELAVRLLHEHYRLAETKTDAGRVPAVVA
tara:strand:+ start:203 stop:1459 length:1257 start_codon:yes stop_codon:yes gene_type:complete